MIEDRDRGVSRRRRLRRSDLDGLIGVVVDQGDLRLDANSGLDDSEVDAPGADRDLRGANARGEGEQGRGEPGTAVIERAGPEP